MNKVTSLILRRMRAPLVVLIVAYAVSIIGLVLIPGVDAHGNPTRIDFFHAFYFVSYMATTIGFGELPDGFTAAQRTWVLVGIYLSVVAWLYAIGKILALMQDQGFKETLIVDAFSNAVRRLTEPFYIICGYGENGSLLVKALTRRGTRAVVLDLDQERINEVELDEHMVSVPALRADASLTESLRRAGLYHAKCCGVAALTNDDQINLHIAITSKLLKPQMQVICRAETLDAKANMESFGTDFIINPYETFAEQFALAVHAPGTYLLHEWLTAVPGTELPNPLYPPRGKWILCGYGRLGRAVKRRLQQERVETVIVEAQPDKHGCSDFCVVGRGTEAQTLLDAGIQDAVGIVAGTDNDANNLSIIITARELKPELCLVARQNRRHDWEIFRAAKLDLVMQRSEIIARDIFALMTSPLLPRFLERARGLSNDWANEVISRISAVTDNQVPEVWAVEVDLDGALALSSLLAAGGETLPVGLLLRHPRERTQTLPCIALMLERGGECWLLPREDEPLKEGDRLLFCGQLRAWRDMQWTLQNHNVLHYVRTGEERPDGWVWRWLHRYLQARAERKHP